MTWRKTTIDAVVSRVQYGYTESASVVSIGPKFLRITDIVKEVVDWATVPYCKISDSDLAKYKLNVGDVVIARTGNTTGESAFIKYETDAVFASYLIRLVPESSLITARFLGYLIAGPSFKNYVHSIRGSKTAQPGINAEDIKCFEFNLPPLPIQGRIASILSAYDNLIENNLRRIKLLEEAARCEYKMLTEESNASVMLNAVSVPIKRGISPKYVDSDGIVVINQKCIRTLNVDFSLSRLTNKNKTIAKERMLQKYDVLVNSTGTGTLGRCSINLNTDYRSTVDSHVSIVRAKDESMGTFLAMSVLSQQHIISMMGRGSTNQTELSPKDLGQEIMIPVVESELIEIFHESVSSKLDLIWNLYKQNSQLGQARDILLPRLMNGDIDVEEVTSKAKLVIMPIKKTMVAEDEVVYETKKPKRGALYYLRTVLAAYIVDQLWQENTFGHVKLMKLMYLCEHLANIETVSNYHRDAAGPYDNQMMRSIDKQLKEKQWFEMYKDPQGFSKYKPMAKRNDYKAEFEKYYMDKQPGIDSLLTLFGKRLTEKAEMVATIYEAWKDLSSK
ncbi:MAG: restriction endonuclease subunit S, partial [Ferruginibacter sp.]